MNVLVFAPYAGIWVHAFPEMLVANALKKAGANLLYVTCDGAYEKGCTTMSAYGVGSNSPDKSRNEICHKCRRNRQLILGCVSSSSINIDQYLDDATIDSIDGIVSSLNLDQVMEYQLDGIRLGRIALHETILHNKIFNLDQVTAEIFSSFKVDFANVLKTYFALKTIIREHKPDRILTYNTHISTNYALLLLAKQSGIKVYGLHAGANLSNRFERLYVFQSDMVVLYKDLINQFEEKYHRIPCSLEQIKYVSAHFQTLVSGKNIFVYSSPKDSAKFDLYGRFEIKADQAVLLATLSSYDEVYSSQVMGVMQECELLFPTQVAWVSNLIEFMRQRSDLFLIIRVHPREFPNRRDAKLSAHAQRLAEEFINLPDNVKVNWPSDNISLYDLAAEVDVVLNGWSSAGKEMSMLGIPVVLYTKDILYYPASLNYLGRSRSEYFEMIDQALNDGWSFERIRRAYRWQVLEFERSTIDISDCYSPKMERPLSVRIVSRVRRRFQPAFEQVADCAKAQQGVSSWEEFGQVILDDKFVLDVTHQVSNCSEEEETGYLVEEVRGIIEKFYGAGSYSETKLGRNVSRFLSQDKK